MNGPQKMLIFIIYLDELNEFRNGNGLIIMNQGNIQQNKLDIVNMRNFIVKNKSEKCTKTKSFHKI